MTHHPKHSLKELTRNPMHVGLFVACCMLCVVIITAMSLNGCQKKKVHPLDKPIVHSPPPEELESVPHRSEFSSEIAILAERITMADWGKVTSDTRSDLARYIAVWHHPNDTPYSHRLRSIYYCVVVKELRETRPQLAEMLVVDVCLINDSDFADYLASHAEAPKTK